MEKDQRGRSNANVFRRRLRALPLASYMPGSVPSVIHTQHFHAQKTTSSCLLLLPPCGLKGTQVQAEPSALCWGPTLWWVTRCCSDSGCRRLCSLTWVLVFWDFLDKVPQLGGPKQQNVFSHNLEAGSLKLRGQQGHSSSEACREGPSQTLPGSWWFSSSPWPSLACGYISLIWASNLGLCPHTGFSPRL